MHCISVTYRKGKGDVREKCAWTSREIDGLQNEAVIT